MAPDGHRAVACDERGLSSAITYAMVVAITLALTAGLVFGTETLIDQNRERIATDQLEVMEQRLATTIETTHRLSRSDSRPETLAVTREFPDRLAGSQYRITIADEGAGVYSLRLEVLDFDITTRTTMRLVHAPNLAETTVNGGHLRVVYDQSGDELEVRHA